MYTRFLGNSFSSAATIKNYLSGARTWVDHHVGDSRAFAAHEPGDVLKRVSSTLQHVTTRAYALTPQDLQAICSFLDGTPSVPLSVKPCILLAYSSFLRASNLTSPLMSVWGGPHTLKACDIVDSGENLYIIVRSTKTLSGASPTYLLIQPSEAPHLCPVRAWREYKQRIKPWPFGPAFLQKDSVPLTPRPVVALMRLALAAITHPHAQQVTMHSLRRGGVQCAAANGAAQEQLMKHGTWKSTSGLKPYLTEDQRIIPRIIAESLAK